MNKIALTILVAMLAACSGDNTPVSSNAAEPVKSPTPVEPSAMASHAATTNQFWWPDRLDLSPLRNNDASANPYGEGFDYAQAFAKLDLAAVRKDLRELMHTSQPWWPADWGHYGPLFIRMAWHSTGTYRAIDGRGGGDGAQQRFEPLNSWPDNASLDKARRLLWPVKQKYGRNISWGDLLALAGTVALEDMGFTTLGFAGGRADDWFAEPVNWGSEKKWLGHHRRDKTGELKGPLAATQMGLIYVNPEGPGGKPDPVAAAKQIRMAFGRMGMNDEETVALIAGGHTFGKAHGAVKADCIGPAPAAAGLEQQGLGWKNKCGKGNAEDSFTSGLEGAWTQTPTHWSMLYLANLLGFEWEKTNSPAGAKQWVAKDGALDGSVADAHVEGQRDAPMMLTTDLALKFDPAYRKIAERFLANQKEFEDAFAHAWFQLTHRDMGPRSRYLGSDIPAEKMLWQDPLPEADYQQIDQGDITELKEMIMASGLSVPELIRTAWAAAASYRDTDHRGGANGARVRLLPQKNWEVNDPEALQHVLAELADIQQAFNDAQPDKTRVSLADVIVLGGAAAIEKAAKQAGYDITVPFEPGRTDATQEMTDIKSFAYLEPTADGFRNYYADGNKLSPTAALINRADLLTLNVAEMTVLVGGMRVLNANTDGVPHGVFTDAPGTLTNDFFVNLLSMSTRWEKSGDKGGIYIGYDRKTGEKQWTATPVDLIFGSNSELRAVAQVYASDDGEKKFVHDFVAAWTKVMRLDRFDLARTPSASKL